MSEDLISKQTAYKVLSEYYHHKTEVQHKALREALDRVPPVELQPTCNKIATSCNQLATDCISRQAAIDVIDEIESEVEDGDGFQYEKWRQYFCDLPPAESKEVIPHRNYKYLSDFWCECGWHLGKKGAVKYCAECGKKVKWDG